MRVLNVLILTVCAAAYITGCSSSSSFIWDEKATETRTLTTEHMDNGSLFIDTRNGSVKIIADDDADDVMIEATVTAADTSAIDAAKRLAETKIIVERDTARQLTIKPQWPTNPRGGEGASFNVRLPEASSITIDSSNGAATVHGFSGRLVIDTSNGAVDVRNHDGDVFIDTSNGPIEVRGTKGKVYADTSNGRIVIVDQHGPVEADTSNGPVEIVLADDVNGPLIVDTSNGPITVTVGSGFGGTVEFDTSNGSIKVDNRGGTIKNSTIGKSDGLIVLGNSGSASVIDTSNASITFIINSDATASANE